MSEDGTFPIVNYGRIPLFVAQLAYEKYAAKYGEQQSLERLGERGGFHPEEMDAFLPDWREHAAGITDLRAQIEAAKARIAELTAELTKAKEQLLLPGELHCAKCGFTLTRLVAYVNCGEIGTGTSETEPCPNGCGQLWPVTWEHAAREAREQCVSRFTELTAERDRLQRINALYEKNFKDPAGHRCGCIFDSNDDVVICCDYHAAWRNERDRLRTAIEQAPHGLHCAHYGMLNQCNCWKRDALHGV